MSKASATALATGTPAAAPIATANPDLKVAPTGTAAGGQPGAVAADSGAAVQTPEQIEAARIEGLTKREAAIVHGQEELKKARAALEVEKATIREKMTPFEEALVLKSKDPIAAMKRLGFTETEVMNFLASGEKRELTPEEKAAAAAQAVIDKHTKEVEEKETKARQAQDTAIIGRFQKQISDTIVKDAEKYQYCAFHGAVAEAQAYENVMQVLKDTGEMISIEEALQMTEDFYESEDKAMQEKVKKRKPVPVEPVAGVTETKVAPMPGKPKTVTNAASPTIAATVNKPESRQEKRARLEAKLRNGAG